MRTRFFLASAVFLAARVAAGQETPSDTLLTVGHYFDLESVGDPQISPDGSQIVYSRRWVNKIEDRYETSLWIMRADGSRNRVFTKGSNPQWSPDGTRIAYLADGEPKGAQIFVRYVDGDPAPTQLTHLTEAPSDVRWSPDGKSIGFTSIVPKPAVWAIDMPKPPDSARWTKAPRIVESTHFREDRRGFQDPGFRHLFVISVDGGPARQITSGDWNVGARFDGLAGNPVGWDWTPDGRTIIVDGWKAPDGDYVYRDANLYAVDVATGQAKALTTERGNWHSPVVSTDGKKIAYVGYPATDQTYRTGGLYVMDIDGSHAKPLTESLDRDVGEVHWAPDLTGLFYTIEDHGAKNVMFSSVAGGAPRAITSGPIVVNFASISHAGVAAITRATAQRPPEVARVDLKLKGDIVQLTHVNEAALSRIHLGAVEEINYASTGGARIQGMDHEAARLRPIEEVPADHGDPRRPARQLQRGVRLHAAELRREQFRGPLRQSARQHGVRHRVRRGHQQGVSERGLR